MVTPDPSGWTLAITHPTSGRVKTPEVLDLQSAPSLNPGPNAQPRLRIPVRKNGVWLSDAYDGDPEMKVWKDGRRLPIEVLRDVEQREDATVLVGVGGVELEQRVSREYNDDRRHIAAGDLVTSETTYASDAPEPDVETDTDAVQQAPDTQAEFDAVSSFPADARVAVVGSVVTGRQVAYTREGTATDAESGSPQAIVGDDYSDGTARAIANTGDRLEWNLTPDHDIPAGELSIWVRDDDGGAGDGSDGAVAFEWRFDGDLVDELTATGANLSLAWTNLADGGYDILTWDSPALTAGETYTISVECTDGGDPSDQYAIDVFAPTDARSDPDLTFDDTVNEPGGYLDGPGFYAPQTATFDNAASAFSVVAGSADLTINDTTGAQRLQISNDNGSTWLPDDGTEDNTTSVSVDYPDAGSGSRLRVTLDAYSPQGTRDQTPRENYASQELDAYTLRADIEFELLLIEETFDNDLASVLTSIAEPAERSWRFAFEDGTPTVRFVQNGQFTADFTPEFEGRTREKLGKTYDSVTIQGSNEPVSNEPYTASTSFSDLGRENILPGSETVYDDTTNYERGTDYEMRYTDGEIRATAGGNLTAGTDYRIDYRYQAQGTFESPDAPADPAELVETVPGVTSERLAEQVAFVIASDVDTPRYAAEVTIPNPDPRFDPVDALPPTALGLPETVDALEVRGDPELTARGLRVRFGTRPAVESSLQRLGRQVSRVTDRS